MKLYTSQKHIGWKANFTEVPVKKSKGRVFGTRRETTFKRPPAIYGNPDPEAIRDKYINMELPEKKRRKP